MLHEDDFKGWLLLPETAALRRWARVKREALRDAWEEGTFSAAFELEMLVKNAGATGACSILREVEELDFETIIQELDDGEYQRAPSKENASEPQK